MYTVPMHGDDMSGGSLHSGRRRFHRYGDQDS